MEFGIHSYVFIRLKYKNGPIAVFFDTPIPFTHLALYMVQGRGNVPSAQTYIGSKGFFR